MSTESDLVGDFIDAVAHVGPLLGDLNTPRIDDPGMSALGTWIETGTGRYIDAKAFEPGAILTAALALATRHDRPMMQTFYGTPARMTDLMARLRAAVGDRWPLIYCKEPSATEYGHVGYRRGEHELWFDFVVNTDGPTWICD